MFTVLIAVATLAGVGMIVPQVRRVRRLRSVEGLSPLWIGVGLAMNSWWTLYAGATRAWDLVPVGLFGVLLYGELARQYLLHGGLASIGRIGRGALAIGWVPVPFMVVAGWQGAGLAIGLCYGAAFVPAAVEAYRSQRIAAIAPATWILAWIEAVIWFGYGLTTADPALLVGGAGGTIMSTAILLRLVAVRVSAPQPRVGGPTTLDGRRAPSASG